MTPEYVMAEEIKEVRKRLGLTQKEFAQLVHCGKATVERWETSKEPIRGTICALIKMLEKYPEYVKHAKIPAKLYPIRLWYMHKQTVCTIIDVDELNQLVQIWNYTENRMFRAFGVEEKPSYQMYLDFLESRCFPESRDKLKLVLQDLNLPFYDPFLIIEKTEGKMAEDDFWIKIER